MLKTGILAMAVAAMLAGPAMADTVTKTFGFTLPHFVDVVVGNTPPYGPISGSFTVTFDPGIDYTDDTADIVVNSFSGLPVSSPLGFTYYSSGVNAGEFYFGEILAFYEGANNIDTETDDFKVAFSVTDIDHPYLLTCATADAYCGYSTGDPSFLASGYTVAPTDSLYIASARGAVLSAPEPAAWALMVGGVGVVGAMIRRKRQALGSGA